MKKINEKKENGRESEKEMEVREKGENEGEKGERKENGGESETEMEVREKGEFCLFALILNVHSTIFRLCGTVLPGFNQY